jgi:hypothetical protein
MRKGVRARTRRTALRIMSICVTNRSERGSRRFTVKKKVPPEPDCGDNPAYRECARAFGGAEGAAPRVKPAG